MSDGASLLRGFLDRNGITQIAASEALHVSDPTVHDWLKGTKRPRAHHRESISVWTRDEVPISSWLREDERATTARVTPFAADESGEHAAATPATGTEG